MSALTSGAYNGVRTDPAIDIIHGRRPAVPVAAVSVPAAPAPVVAAPAEAVPVVPAPAVTHAEPGAPPSATPQGPPRHWTMPTTVRPPVPAGAVTRAGSPPVARRTDRGSPRMSLAWPALLSWLGGVTLVILAVVVGFALWMSGGRNESLQRQGFPKFNAAALLMETDEYPEKVWPKNVPVALVRFQRFGRSVAVFGGIGKSELRRGPGYDPTTPMIGELGNTVFIGKSSTYGSPFAGLDRMLVGDQLVVKSGYGSLAYRVTEVLTVDRNAPEIYQPVTDDSRLSLVGHNGHPFSSERVLVRASLDATGALHDVTLPVVPPSSSTGFAPLLIAGLACCVAVMVMLGEQVLPQFTTQRAARWIMAPLVLALTIPLAEQLLLALPRTW